MKTTTTLAALTAAALVAGSASAQFVTYNDRAAFLAALDSTLIDDDLERYGSDIDFDNSTVNTVSPGNPLQGFDASHTGDEVTTQFVNGSLTNSTETGNPGIDMQFLLDLAGVTGAFGSQSNVADVATITVQTAGVNAFGFDTFGFNDQGLAFLQSPQALGVEMGVATTVTDTAGNTVNFTVNPDDPFFGIVGYENPIDTVTFSAIPTFANSGTEFIAIDNFVGGTSSVPEPASAALLGLAGLVLARRRHA